MAGLEIALAATQWLRVTTTFLSLPSLNVDTDNPLAIKLVLDAALLIADSSSGSRSVW